MENYKLKLSKKNMKELNLPNVCYNVKPLFRTNFIHIAIDLWNKNNSEISIVMKIFYEEHIIF